MLLVISGPSGAGKTTITRAIRERFPEAVFSVSATTRPPGPGETDGVDYHFLSPEEFERRVQAGEFLEHAEYAGNRYGTLRAPVQERLDAGRIVLLDIDVQGAKQIKDKAPEMFALFVEPPDEESLLRRLRARRRDSEEVIQRRLSRAKREMDEARRSGVYDAFIVNDDLAQAVEQAVSLVQQARARRGVSRPG